MSTLFDQKPAIPSEFQEVVKEDCSTEKEERRDPHAGQFSEQEKTEEPRKKTGKGWRRFFRKLGDAFCRALPKVLCIITTAVMQALLFSPKGNRVAA